MVGVLGEVVSSPQFQEWEVSDRRHHLELDNATAQTQPSTGQYWPYSLSQLFLSIRKNNLYARTFLFFLSLFAVVFEALHSAAFRYGSHDPGVVVCYSVCLTQECSEQSTLLPSPQHLNVHSHPRESPAHSHWQ